MGIVVTRVGVLFTQAERSGSARFGLLFLPTQFALYRKRGFDGEDASLQVSPFPPKTVQLCLRRWFWSATHEAGYAPL